MSLEDKINWAWRYIDRGWPVFVLGRDKTPLPNCRWCRGEEPGSGRCVGRGTCGHMYCHGFYAATTHKALIESMITGAPDGMLGIRTGDSLCVLDFEGTEKGQETYDNFEAFTGGVDLPHDGLAQRTGGGGIHVIVDVRSHLIRSRNRVLPDLDIKSAGGYIAVGPSEDGRGWLNDGVRNGWSQRVPQASPELIGWLVGARGNFVTPRGVRTGGVPDGVAVDWYRDALTNGCPGGLRDEFFNRLVFSLRKSGMDRAHAENKIAEHWWACQQHSIGGEWRGAEWDMPWEHVLYKIDRTWATVEPDEIPEWQERYIQAARNVQQLNEGAVVNTGKVAMVRREGRR